jgi:hypothetical protein
MTSDPSAPKNPSFLTLLPTNTPHPREAPHPRRPAQRAPRRGYPAPRCGEKGAERSLSCLRRERGLGVRAGRLGVRAKPGGGPCRRWATDCGKSGTISHHRHPVHRLGTASSPGTILGIGQSCSRSTRAGVSGPRSPGSSGNGQAGTRSPACRCGWSTRSHGRSRSPARCRDRVRSSRWSGIWARSSRGRVCRDPRRLLPRPDGQSEAIRKHPLDMASMYVYCVRTVSPEEPRATGHDSPGTTTADDAAGFRPGPGRQPGGSGEAYA